jgi:hypothetical protein
MLTAAFVLVGAEYRSTDNALAGARASALAQAGMQAYFAASRSLTAAMSNDSVRYTYTDGYADIVARKMRTTNTGITSWVIKATGTTTDPLLTGQVTARRVIGQMALLYPPSMPARAALVALNDVEIMSKSGDNPLDGRDTLGSFLGCTAPVGFAADTTAVTTPPSGYMQGSAPAPGGDPPEALASLAAVFDSTHIDWATILSGNFTPDYTQSGGTLDYPAPAPPTNTAWQVGYVTGNVTIPGFSGFPNAWAQQGVLIVTGDVTMGDKSHWDGIIIAGGKLEGISTTSEFLVHGMVVTGLNCITSVCPGKTRLRRDSHPTAYRTIRWSWCWAHIGIGMLAAMAPVKNTFIGNWAAY